jgi:hypothetical protein
MNPDRIGDFLKAIKPEQRYNDFLKDRRVAVVGPSKHILLEKNGNYIDDHDAVVRMKWLPVANTTPSLNKKSYNPFKQSIGNRTSVMYSSQKNSKADFEVLMLNDVLFYIHPECKINCESEILFIMI